MIKFKMIKPFVLEFFSLMIAVLVFVMLLIKRILAITISFPTVIIGCLLVICTLPFFCRVIKNGFSVLVDFVFQLVETDNYIFLDIYPFKSSIFCKNHINSFGMYYKIIMRKGENNYTFVSPCYIELKKGKKYTVTNTRLSHIFIEKY